MTALPLSNHAGAGEGRRPAAVRGRRPEVLIADATELFRVGLARLLADDPRVDVVGLARNGAEAVSLATHLRPDAVLMDLSMPVMDGVAATAEIKRRVPSVRVLILAKFDRDRDVIAAHHAGAEGYLLKDSPVESVITGILAVVAGEWVIAAAVASRVLDDYAGGPAWRGRHVLTSRETELIRMVAAGLSNRQVAMSLGIAQKTVRNHLSHAYEKLGARDRAEAAMEAGRIGLTRRAPDAAQGAAAATGATDSAWAPMQTSVPSKEHTAGTSSM